MTIGSLENELRGIKYELYTTISKIMQFYESNEDKQLNEELLDSSKLLIQSPSNRCERLAQSLSNTLCAIYFKINGKESQEYKCTFKSECILLKRLTTNVIEKLSGELLPEISSYYLKVIRHLTKDGPQMLSLAYSLTEGVVVKLGLLNDTGKPNNIRTESNSSTRERI